MNRLPPNPVHRAVLGALLVLLLGSPYAARAGESPPEPPGRSGWEVVERIVTLVDEEPIFLSELRRRAIPFYPRLLAAPLGQREALLEQLYRQILERLIDEKLIAQEARRMKLRVSSDEVRDAIERVRRQSGLSEEAFWATLRDSGLREQDYRAEVRRQVLRLKVIGHRLRGRVDVSEEDVRRLYEERIREARGSLRFHASHCLFRIPAEASPAEAAALRMRAEEAVQRLDATTFTRCIEANEGGDLGWLQKGDLPAALESALLTMQPGTVAGPVRGPAGYHVFLLHEREEGGEAPSFEQMKGQLYRELLDRRMAEQERRFQKELRTRARIERRL